MRRVLFILACCSILFTVVALAQGRKSGLWEMTTTMNFQGMPQMGGSPHTTQVCVTQAQLDKYNAIVSPLSAQQHDCQMTNVVKTAKGMTAEMVCTGRMAGKG